MHISTRMLRSVAMLGIAMVGSTALAVGPLHGVPYGQDFEDELLWADNAKVKTTNGWFSGEADASSISNNVNITGYSGAFPITGNHATGNRVIRLNTEGTTLTNQLSSGAGDFTNSKLYVDTMVNFVISEDIPTAVSNDVNVKAAVFLKADGATTNLYVFHGQMVGGVFGGPAFSAITNGIAPGTWYRLTIELGSTSGLSGDAEAFRVLINGKQLLSETKGYGTNWATRVFESPNTANGGAWFLSAARRDGPDGLTPSVVGAVAFQGTGYIDDLVITDDDPLATAGSFTITQFVGSDGSASPAGTITVAAGGTTSIVYTASQWFRIAALTNDTTAVGGAVDAKVYTNTLTVNANRNTYVHFKAATATQAGIPGTVDPDWANNYYATEAAAANDGSLATDYLLGLIPTTEYTIGFAIDSINVAGTTITVVTKLTDAGNPLPTTITGQLQLLGRTSITNTGWDVITAATMDNASFNAIGTCTNTFNDAVYKFYKATIVP